MTPLTRGDWAVMRCAPGWRVLVVHLLDRLPDDTGWQVERYELVDDRVHEYRVTPATVLDADILDTHLHDTRRFGVIDDSRREHLLGLAWVELDWRTQNPEPVPDPQPVPEPAPVAPPPPEPEPGPSWTPPPTPPRWAKPTTPRESSPPLPGRRDRKVRRPESIYLLRTWNEHGRVTMRRMYLREYAAMRQVAYWEARGVTVTLDVSRYRVRWEPLW